MPLIIKPLIIELFSKFSQSEHKAYSEIGKKMLEVIDVLRNSFLETEIIALSSHENLLLFAPHDINNWSVLISTKSGYSLKYINLKERKYEDGTYATDSTNSIEEFKKFLINAMTRSEGWKESIELKLLFETL